MSNGIQWTDKERLTLCLSALKRIANQSPASIGKFGDHPGPTCERMSAIAEAALREVGVDAFDLRVFEEGLR